MKKHIDFLNKGIAGWDSYIRSAKDWDEIKIVSSLNDDIDFR